MTSILALLLALSCGSGWARELSLIETLQLSDKTSPQLKISQEKENQSTENLRIAKSSLYPSLDLSAVQSYGFPGSSSPTPGQFGGILNSPYRSGPGISLLGKLSLLDLSKWKAVTAAKWNESSAELQTKSSRILVFQKTLKSYFEATRSRGEFEIWKEISAKIEKLSTASKNRVQSGQLSDVSGLLISDQVSEVQMNLLSAQKKYQQSLRQLSIELDLGEQEISCPPAVSLSEDILKDFTWGQKNPKLSQIESQIEEAKARASQVSMQHLPQLFASASIGYIEDARFFDKQNYSAWVGVTLPIFEGFRVSAESQKMQSLVHEKENELRAAKMELDQSNSQYDEEIELAQLKISLLEQQKENVVKTFDLARKRYLSFIGPVVEVRESLRSMARVQIQLNSAKADFLYAKSGKILLSGGSFLSTK